jgi:pilus assembly protein Flp/PilA
MSSLLKQFAQNESGATAIEYGLIATLISIALIVGATALGSKLNLVFNGLSTKMGVP